MYVLGYVQYTRGPKMQEITPQKQSNFPPKSQRESIKFAVNSCVATTHTASLCTRGDESERISLCAPRLPSSLAIADKQRPVKNWWSALPCSRPSSRSVCREFPNDTCSYDGIETFTHSSAEARRNLSRSLKEHIWLNDNWPILRYLCCLKSYWTHSEARFMLPIPTPPLGLSDLLRRGKRREIEKGPFGFLKEKQDWIVVRNTTM